MDRREVALKVVLGVIGLVGVVMLAQRYLAEPEVAVVVPVPTATTPVAQPTPGAVTATATPEPTNPRPGCQTGRVITPDAGAESDAMPFCPDGNTAGSGTAGPPATAGQAGTAGVKTTSTVMGQPSHRPLHHRPHIQKSSPSSARQHPPRSRTSNYGADTAASTTTKPTPVKEA